MPKKYLTSERLDIAHDYIHGMCIESKIPEDVVHEPVEELKSRTSTILQLVTTKQLTFSHN